MIAGDDDLVRVGQCAQKIVKLADVLQRPVTGQVAGVDQDVPVWDGQGSVKSVGVAKSDDFHDKDSQY